MKRIIVFLVLFCALITLASCNKTHTHNYSSDYSYDAEKNIQFIVITSVIAINLLTIQNTTEQNSKKVHQCAT